jgi:hypothetical protein
MRAESRKYAAMVAAFCPKEALGSGVTVDDVRIDRAIDAGEGRACELVLVGPKAVATADHLVTTLLDPVRTNSSPSAAEAFAATLAQLDRTLQAACTRLGKRTLWRGIRTDDRADLIARRMARSWSACSTEQSIAERFAGDDGVLLKVEVQQDTIGLYLPGVLPTAWACFAEKETLLAPGCDVFVASEAMPTAFGEHRVVTLVVRGGGRRQFVRGSWQ